MSKCFVVLGMHRSATSLTAKGLLASGVHMGDDLLIKGQDGGKHQEFGHYENNDFIKMNKMILRQSGGSWVNIPSIKRVKQAGVDMKDEICELIEKSKRDLWGWKDPRTSLTFHAYAPYLDNVHLICNFRDVEEVAKSLHKRHENGLSIKFCRELAKGYNKRIIEILQEYT